MFTPDVSLTNARLVGDGSPVTKNEPALAFASTSTSTMNSVPTMGESGPPIHLVGAFPVPPPTVPMASMPSTTTLHMLVTGPSNVPADGSVVVRPVQYHGGLYEILLDNTPTFRMIYPQDDLHTRYFFNWCIYLPTRLCAFQIIYPLYYMTGLYTYQAHSYTTIYTIYPWPIHLAWVHTFTRLTPISRYNYYHGPMWDGPSPLNCLRKVWTSVPGLRKVKGGRGMVWNGFFAVEVAAWCHNWRIFDIEFVLGQFDDLNGLEFHLWEGCD
ncbi:uncharacterized protein EDB93DRAFT_1107261 [Suillus bovinus]|uniref:uncharacterized protein n=1 Tax=Suillus bovinus TaxID=48563 RepID=UPI001B8664A0|nr:uncharacterized protein EDB93DRAFT_1107261 [Suillus bovinus]KAG2134557.1 hypothetical protein EDB93DRAFT_1107261 [Suillus bovinus]